MIKDSPTCTNEVFRILIAIYASKNNWTECRAMDVKTAFFQFSSLTRDVFSKPPKERDSGKSGN